jgi:hypothetical protein
MVNNNQNLNQPFITPPQGPGEETQTAQDIIDNDFAQAQNQLRQVSLSESGWKKELHQQMNEIRELADSPKAITDDGIATIELLMRNLGMPSVTFSGKALDLLDKREEAMFEERSLREQGKSYQTLGNKEKQEAENRVYNGIQFRNDWRRLYDFAKNSDYRFGTKPTTPTGQTIQEALLTMTENEIRLAAVRESSLELNFSDSENVKEIATRIINNAEFLKILSLEKATSPNVTNIKFEIKKRILTNETAGNL